MRVNIFYNILEISQIMTFTLVLRICRENLMINDIDRNT